MKLRLENQDGISILSVSDDITSLHASILRAGLMKLFNTGKKTVLLDLLAVGKTPPDVLREIAMIQHEAPENDAQMLIASTIPGVGNVMSREEGMKQIRSPMFILLSTEARAHARIKRLGMRKAEIENRLTTSGNTGSGLRTLRKENSDLKKMVRFLEESVSKLLDKRAAKEEQTPDDMKARAESLMRTLVPVLEQEGILPLS